MGQPRSLKHRMYSITEVAKYLSVSKRTVQRLIAGGKLQASTVGGQKRITPQALETLLRDGANFDAPHAPQYSIDLF
jgi:excisionase family DNA binding protein